MKNHRKEEHDKSLHNRRIKQNLVAINFDDDSDDDLEWSPILDDEGGHIVDSRMYIWSTPDVII